MGQSPKSQAAGKQCRAGSFTSLRRVVGIITFVPRLILNLIVSLILLVFVP